MGLPSTSFEGLYRNNMEDVKRFFNKRHPFHHKIYNLCSEKQYPNDSFYSQGYYPFPDHEAPPLALLMPFCQDAKKFLDDSDKNVVAIHCKAGKGRTGTFICCLLLYLGIFDTADECMKYYGLMRVGAEKGVTIPSQKRYVNYFEQILKNNISTDPLKYKKICIQELKMYTIPSFSKFGSSCTPTFIIQNNKKEYKYSDINKKKTTYNKTAVFPLNNAKIEVSGDVLITFYHLQFFGKDKMFKFWFNTQFLDENGILEIGKSGLDKAFKDKENKLFSPDFKIEMKYIFL
jgi:phosphatidylinositol-3,4,5-trisphosphate 3-phosphatase/dual-specificity protein phosphatase PTEN